MADGAVAHLQASLFGVDEQGGGDDDDDDGAAAGTTPRPVDWKVDVVTERNAVGTASGILVVARTSTGCLLAGSALGRPDRSARATGQDAAQELRDAVRAGGCVDDWMQDQLVLYMALAEGVSTVLVGSLTLHTRTAIWVAEQLSGAKFEVERVREPGKERTVAPSILPTTTGGEDRYGSEGRIEGKHLIRCHGIGFQPRSMSR
jgi:RNA 3'-terminal phosphate cyclase (ATP)